MNGEDGVRARRVHVEVVVCGSSALFALEQAVQGFLLVTAFRGGEATNGDFPINVILHRDARACLVLWLRLRQHVEHELVIDLYEGDANFDLIVETAADFAKNFVDCARDQASVLVVGSGTAHSESFSCSRLSVTHDGAVKTVDNLVDRLLRAVLEHFLLRGVVHDFVEFECPLLLLVVHEALGAILGHCESHRLKKAKVVNNSFESNSIRVR